MKVLPFRPAVTAVSAVHPELQRFREMVNQLRDDPTLVIGLCDWEPCLLRPSAYRPSPEFQSMRETA